LSIEIFPTKYPPEVANPSFASIHNKLGHPSDEIVKATAKKLHINLDPKTDICEPCAISKSKRKKIAKQTTNHAKSPGERIMIDISYIKEPSQGGNKFWLLIVDEFTSFSWSYFMTHKSDTAKTMIKFIRFQKLIHGIIIKKIRCDNSGENIKFQELAHEQLDIGIKFEFTTPYTPEQNGKVERKFATLFSKTRAMLNHARLPQSIRNKLWAQCANHATDLDNVIVTDSTSLTPIEKYHGSLPKWINSFRIFGEIGIVRDSKSSKFKAKLTNRGFPAMFVGYGDTTHPKGVFPNVQP